MEGDEWESPQEAGELWVARIRVGRLEKQGDWDSCGQADLELSGHADLLNTG